MILKVKYFILLYAMLSLNTANVLSEKLYANVENRIGNEINYSVKCIKNIAKKYFPPDTLLTLVYSKMSVDDLARVLSDNSSNSLVIRSFEKQDWLISTNAYIIVVIDKFELLSGLISLRRDVLWNPRATFIIRVKHLKVEEMSEVFKIFHYYKVYKIILVNSEDDEIIIYTYYPLSKGRCNYFQDPVALGKCEDVENIKNIFENEVVPINDNCTFRVIACQEIPYLIFQSSNFTVFGEYIPGIEQFLFSTIAENERVQFEYILKPPEYKFGFVLENGTATGLLAYLENDSADIAAGGFILIKNRIEMFDYIWGFHYSFLNIFTPTQGGIIWQYIGYREFSFNVWILILAVYCLIVVILFVKRNTLHKILQNRINLALKLWGYLFGNTNNRLSKEKSIRIIFIWWIWFTFFIINFYNTAMFSLITRKVNVKTSVDPDRLEELPYEPCIADTNRMFLKFAFNKTLPNSKTNDEPCQNSDTSFDFIASRKDFYTIDTEFAYKLNAYKYIDKDGHSKLDSVEIPTSNIMTFYFSRGFPFKDVIDKYAKRMLETGLFENLINTILSHGRFTPHRHSQELISFKIIKIGDLIIHCYILLGGIAVSFVIFIVEITVHRKMVRN